MIFGMGDGIDEISGEPESDTVIVDADESSVEHEA